MFSPPARLCSWKGMVQRKTRTQQQSNSLLPGNQCSPPESTDRKEAEHLEQRCTITWRDTFQFIDYTFLLRVFSLVGYVTCVTRFNQSKTNKYFQPITRKAKTTRDLVDVQFPALGSGCALLIQVLSRYSHPFPDVKT